MGLAVGVKGENLRLMTTIAECYITSAGKAAASCIYTCKCTYSCTITVIHIEQ